MARHFGAVLGTVAQLLSPNPISSAAKALGIAGSLAVALAGFAAAQAVSGDKEKLWIRCRAAGEALKSTVYLYSASVSPFDAPNRGAALAQRVEKALRDLDGVALRPGRPDKPPPGALNVTEYIAARVDDQIDYYTRSASKYQRKADFWRYCALAGAATSAGLAVVSAMFSLSPWVALLATVTTSITAYVKNHRYELLIGLYQATAMRLQLLKDQWLDSGKTDADKAERDSLIQRCEETLALENGGWVAQWSQQLTQADEAGRQ